MSEAELRAMVREVLREALAKGGKPKAPLPTRSEAVRIASDADLAAFVQRLAAMMDDPAKLAALRSGSLRFTLACAPATPAAVSAPVAGTMMTGTITEAKVARLKGAGTLVLAPDAVITPLARDRARALGLKIERRR